ncbi:hypothetical protein B7P43_G00377 [Cryptotermes secundus]|uniref:Mos1 transposase HTH domain-containing protein n=1 Tax=Cryptotermes secundus TaxID=105785 RepID=A0A2J7R8T0_9NEOP|nr:hypothetical protein B7P43_G00377 [Cryptotermes secundus]
MDQRICIKFCVKNEIKCYKVCEMLTKAYGESVMSKTRVYEWYKRFQDGREDVADDERPGRPSTSTTDENVEKVKAMIMNDRRITIREVADDVGISIGSCHEIFSNVLVQRRLREAIRKKRPDLWKNNSWLLHHDNAPAHTSLLVREFLAKNNTVTMPQPPYSPDMAPCDFFLFPKIKRTLKGRRFTSIDDIKSASLKELKAIPKIEFEKCFDDWKKRWCKCIISNGDYFEGDNINVDE